MATVLGAGIAILLALSLPRTRPWVESEDKSFAQEQLTELSLQDGVVDKALLLKIFPSAEFVKAYLPELKEEKLSIYYKWRGRWLGQDASRYAPISDTQISGEITTAYPVNSGIEVVGWADETDVQRHYRWVILTDEQRKIVGFGEKLPAGFPPGVPAAHTPPSLGWVGFANLHFPVKTISAYLVDEHGRGLIPVPGSIAAPTTQAAEFAQVGPNLPGILWSGAENWAKGQVPPVPVGDEPAAPVYSSWFQSDRYTGNSNSAIFDTPSGHCVILPVLHGPRVGGLSVALIDSDSGQVLATAPMQNEDTIWHYWRVAVPSSTRHLQIKAADHGQDWGEWVAVAGPAECK